MADTPNRALSFSLPACGLPPSLPSYRLSLSAIAIDVRKIVSSATNMTTIKITAMPMATGRRETPIEKAGADTLS